MVPWYWLIVAAFIGAVFGMFLFALISAPQKE